MNIDQRVAGKIIGFEILMLGHRKRALDQRRGAGVEEFEIPGIENDSGRIAVAPLYAHPPGIDQHALA